jgi:phospholipase/carboxylesterase
VGVSWSSRSCRRTHVARPRGEGVTPGTSRSALRDQEPLVTAGPPWEQARAAAILLHGRGGTARGILSLADVVDRPEVAWIAPEANGNAWYPKSFLAPLSDNEPWLSAALDRVGGLVERLELAGVPAERALLIGFSQGGCLALEFAARNARRYGGIAGLAAGLIGAPGTPRDYPGSLAGTPSFLGCSDRDPFVPLERVEEAARVLARMEANVTKRIYSGLGHTVNNDEIAHVRTIVDEAVGKEDR